MRCTLAFALAAFLPHLAAQSITVDYPDSVIGALAGQYPIYTGTALNVIRGQSFMPGTFAGVPAGPMICTRIGIQLGQSAGPITYAQFVLRAGATQQTALTSTFATNLPDQRIQMDLSGQTLTGGPNVNVWVEYPLAFPFYWQPGDGVVIDFTTQSAVAGQYLRTAIGTGVPRCISTSYTGSGSGTASTSGGIKFRMVFEPLGLTQWGNGCAGMNALVPAIGSMGQSTVGSTNYMVMLSNALGGTAAAFLLGFGADFDVGGGCRIYNDAAYFAVTGTTGTGPGAGTAAYPLLIPSNSGLVGLVLNTQWAVMDPFAVSLIGASLTPGGKIVIY